MKTALAVVIALGVPFLMAFAAILSLPWLCLGMAWIILEEEERGEAIIDRSPLVRVFVRDS